MFMSPNLPDFQIAAHSPLVSAMQSKVEERVLKPRQQETHDTHHDDNSGTPPDTEVDHSSPATPSGQGE